MGVDKQEHDIGGLGFQDHSGGHVLSCALVAAETVPWHLLTSTNAGWCCHVDLSKQYMLTAEYAMFTFRCIRFPSSVGNGSMHRRAGLGSEDAWKRSVEELLSLVLARFQERLSEWTCV